MKKNQTPTGKEVSDSIKAFLAGNQGQLNENVKDLLNPSLLEYLSNTRLKTTEPGFAIHAGEYEYLVASTIEQLQSQQFVSRLHKKDVSLWNGEAGIRSLLGWLDVCAEMRGRVEEIKAFVAKVKASGFRHAVLLGMGGSSLASFVFRQMCAAEGIDAGISFHILDSTHPVTVKELEDSISLDDTLFIVASKSGSTAEIKAFFRYFYHKMEGRKGKKAGQHFIAITDPDTALEKEATSLDFLHIFRNFADIGGRYSVLSCFGLVPAALMGLDVERLLDSAEAMVRRSASQDITHNPSVQLGVAMGTLSRLGRDKLTIIMPRELSAFGWWVEQLVAESTGKQNVGVLPVDHLFTLQNKSYADDRVFVNIHTAGSRDELVKRFRSEGHPVIDIRINSVYDLAGEFYRWEIATATAGSVLKINPFDQPNVQENKTCTEKLLSLIERGEKPREEALALVEKGLTFYSTLKAVNTSGLLEAFFSRAHTGSFTALQAYLHENEETDRLLKEIAFSLENWLGIASTIGYGPRFLHSTGQFHKGGTNSGYFIQLTADPEQDLAIPGRSYSFGQFINAQATGDFETMIKHNRRVIRVHLGKDVHKSLSVLKDSIEAAATEYYMNVNHTE